MLQFNFGIKILHLKPDPITARDYLEFGDCVPIVIINLRRSTKVTCAK